MDSFTFLLFLLILTFLIQAAEWWMTVGGLLLMIISTKDAKATIAMVLSAAVLYFFIKFTDITTTWPIVIFGLIILSMIFGATSKDQAPEMYSPDLGGYGPLLGGI